MKCRESRHTRILHAMETTPWKYCHFARRQCFTNELCTILLKHIRACCTLYGDDHVRRPWVIMRGQHSTGPKIEHSDGHAITDHSREGSCIGVDDGPWGVCVVWLGPEVEEPIGVRRKQGKTIEFGGGYFKKDIEGGINCFVDPMSEGDK